MTEALPLAATALVPLEECGLHRRVARAIVRLSGTSPRGLVAGFMAATALLSMWVSNTATVVMMLPMALVVIAWHDERPEATPAPRCSASRRWYSRRQRPGTSPRIAA